MGQNMRVGSGSDSVYMLLQPKVRSERLGEGAAQQTSPSGQGVGGLVSSDAAAAALQARLAASSFDRYDTDQDGIVERAEFIKSNMEERSDGYQPDLDDVLNHWNKLDAEGKGALTEEEYTKGFSSVVQVSVGQFDKPLGG